MRALIAWFPILVSLAPKRHQTPSHRLVNPATFFRHDNAHILCLRSLSRRSNVSDQLRLLKSLGHWVGDIHQPLHVSFDDDRGGNLVAIAGPCKFNLHSVWDNCIIGKKIGVDYADVAAKLRAEITDKDRAQWVPPIIDTAAVVTWANESADIAERYDVQYCIQKNDACWYASDQEQYRGGIQRVVTVDDAYLTAQAATVRERLKMAGVRLGAILNTALMPG
ncbi:MAG: S1/P1 nuclease [Rhodomicrobium sp.]